MPEPSLLHLAANNAYYRDQTSVCLSVWLVGTPPLLSLFFTYFLSPNTLTTSPQLTVTWHGGHRSLSFSTIKECWQYLLSRRPLWPLIIRPGCFQGGFLKCLGHPEDPQWTPTCFSLSAQQPIGREANSAAPVQDPGERGAVVGFCQRGADAGQYFDSPNLSEKTKEGYLFIA